MSSEREIPQEKLPQKEPRYDVRVFPYGMRSFPELLKDIHTLKPEEKLSLFEVYMGKKTNLLDNTKDIITPFGGQLTKEDVKDKTKLEKASLSVLNEQSTLIVVPFSEPTSDKLKYEYKLNSDDPNSRVYLKSVFVINPNILQAICLEPNITTNIEMVSMSLLDFENSTKNRTYKGQKMADITDSFTENSEISISERDQFRRETYLNTLFLDIEEQENIFRETLKNRLILDASRANMSFVSSDISLESVLKTIEQTGKLDEILKSSLDRIVRENYMNYFRNYEKKQFTKTENFEQLENRKQKSDVIKNELDLIKARIVDGNFGVDLLHFIPLYTQANMHPEARTTRSINTSARLIRDSLKYCLNKSSIDGLNSFTDAKDLIEGISVPLSKKFEFFKKMDEQMLELLSEKIGKTKRYVTRAWFESQKFIPEIGETAKSVDPNLFNIYQFHELRNEVSNSSMVQTIFLGLGIDSKKNSNEHLSRIRFEALRQLAVFSKFLFENDIYERISQRGINPIDFAINNFFGPVETTEHTKFKDEKTGMEYEKPIERRRDLKGRMFIIDEKPTKPLDSFIRKSFETKHTNILDLHSANVILADEQYKNLPLDEKINLMNNVAEEFFQYLRENYPDFTIAISGDKNTYENFTAFKNGETIEKKGKRTGSQASRIVRRKMYVKMSKQDGDKIEDYAYELVFYPFEKLAKMSEGEMLGWMDKIADDPSYKGKRLMEPLKNAYGLNSLHGSLFNSSIYLELAKKMHSHIALEKGSKMPSQKKNKN